MIDKATVIAAMAAVEAETRERAIAVVREYAARKAKKAQSRIASAKAAAAIEIAELLEALPHKSH